MTNYRHVSPDIMAAALKGDGEVNDITEKALALIKPGALCEVNFENISILATALTSAIEAHEATKQKVSDAVADAKFMIEAHCDEEASTLLNNRLSRFIIPDPLVEVLEGLGCYDAETDAADLRAALDARGYEIREKNDD